MSDKLLARKIVVPGRIDRYENDLAFSCVVDLIGDFNFVSVHELLHRLSKELRNRSGVVFELVEDFS